MMVSSSSSSRSSSEDVKAAEVDIGHNTAIHNIAMSRNDEQRNTMNTLKKLDKRRSR